MPPARRAFLARLVDYAGLFPPAALDLDAALQTYAAARGGEDAWMLGRFIVPAGTLGDLAASADGPLRLSVLGHGSGEGSTSWDDRAARTLADARAVEAESDGALVCDRFEVRLPTAIDADALAQSLGALDEALGSGPGPAPRVALEAPFLDAPASLGPAVQAIADANGRAGRPAFALKLRCGGVTADLFPGVEALAEALAEALRAGVPFKATAGLHHPVRQYRDEVGTEMHGFVNVFGGAVLARLHGLGPDALAEILDDTDPSHFELGDALRWRSLSATAAEVADAREQSALSYGSCSFDEPTDDLRALGWL